MTPAYVPREAFQSIPQGPIPEAFQGFDSSKGSPFMQMMQERGQLMSDGSRELLGIKLLAPRATPAPKPSPVDKLSDSRVAAFKGEREQAIRRKQRAPLVAGETSKPKGFVSGIRFAKPAINRKKKPVVDNPEAGGEGIKTPV